MTKTIVHWTEDMNIQSRHPLAQSARVNIDKTILLSTRVVDKTIYGQQRN